MINKINVYGTTFGVCKLNFAGKKEEREQPLRQKPVNSNGDEKAKVVFWNLSSLYDVKRRQAPGFPKAICREDITLLSSNQSDDLKKWVVWENPEDGRKYTVINKKDNPDGTRTMRVLNEDGELVKECDIKPKKMILIDAIGYNKPIDLTSEYWLRPEKLAEITFARNNPMADLEILDVSHMYNRSKLGNKYAVDNNKLFEAFDTLLARIDAGEGIDLVFCSLKDAFRSDNDDARRVHLTDMGGKKLKYALEGHFVSSDEVFDMLYAAFNKIAETGDTRMLYAYDPMIAIEALSLEDMTEENQGIRLISAYADEQKITMTKDGVNVSGKPGIDFKYNEDEHNEYEMFVGKKAEDLLASPEETEEYLRLYNDYEDEVLDEEDYYDSIEKFRGKIFKYSDLYGNKPDVPNLYTALFYGNELTVDSSGYIVPYPKNTTYNTSQVALLKKMAQELLNDTMTEIL